MRRYWFIRDSESKRVGAWFSISGENLFAVPLPIPLPFFRPVPSGHDVPAKVKEKESHGWYAE